jgi:quercetin dioxygenase-like cupin family protein
MNCTWAADTAADSTMVNSDAVKWGDAPPSVPKGAKLAVLNGDPSKAGPFTMRLKLPAGYKIPPHTHTQSENLTVLSGELYLGMGDKLDTSHGHGLKAGGFHYLPGKTPHYAYTKAPTVVQVHGEGPFDINYLNPADNPDKSAKQ